MKFSKFLSSKFFVIAERLSDFLKVPNHDH